ncbi:MAG: AzlD domain-containing protein [Firmicutes bacterium]|nr:AzlD domain-containing protein [Bacillota bacterium]
MNVQTFTVMLLGMVLVTYLPRTLPLFLSNDRPLPTWLERWLKLVPYTALGALIFPGILTVDPNRPWVGVLGGIAAILVSWKWNNLVATVIVAFLVVYGLS